MSKGMTLLPVVALLTAFVSAPARANDDWDEGSDSDNGASTDNELFHGAEQVHDLASAAPPWEIDFYRVRGHSYSSYQMVVDGMASDLRLQPSDLRRMDAGGSLPLQTSIATDGGGVLSLQWQEGPGSADYRVWVGGANVCDVCTELDTYRIRFYDTTYTLPRFNNTGTQSTVLLVQNTTDRDCSATYWFFSGGSAFAGTTQPLPARGLNVLATASIVGGFSGSVRVTHDCGYGGLSGKAVALEPSTGFTFDTPLVPRPN